MQDCSKQSAHPASIARPCKRRSRYSTLVEVPCSGITRAWGGGGSSSHPRKPPGGHACEARRRRRILDSQQPRVFSWSFRLNCSSQGGESVGAGSPRAAAGQAALPVQLQTWARQSSALIRFLTRVLRFRCTLLPRCQPLHAYLGARLLSSEWHRISSIDATQLGEHWPGPEEVRGAYNIPSASSVLRLQLLAKRHALQ